MRPPPWQGPALPLGLCGTAVLGLALLLWPAARPALAAGWLAALLFWLGIALGALALLAIHALTGGRWGTALRPVLAPAAGSLPLFLPLALPLLLSLGVLYPWVAEPELAGHPDVARLYLNAAGFILRTGLALLLWSALAWLLLRLEQGPARQGVAALGLVLHGVAVTLLGFDWVLSLAPHFHSTAFGLSLLVSQLLAALAWAALCRGTGEDAAADLGGLLLAAVLGALYLGFSQYLVIWYGNLPHKAAWYLARQASPWLWLEALSLLLSGLLPLLVLLPGGLRRSPAAQARLAPWLLAGLSLHHAWLVAPAAGPWSLPAAALAMLSMGGLWLGLAYRPLAAWLAPAPQGRAA
ncbi:hypothetical protein [Teichococcus aestuarii]|uniref:hypothetical protein n=1 Tax=Teichococcus aestuarii TaxID=568898 RepID=UPI00360C6C15